MKGIVEKVVLIALGLAISGYLYYAYYLGDVIGSINAVRHDISVSSQTIRNLQNEKKTIKQKIEIEKNQGSEVNSSVPDNFDKTEIIRYFYDTIKTYGLTTDKAALTESLSKDYRTGSISFKVSGTYDSVRNFMRQIENEKRKFVIKQVNMGYEGDSFSATMTVEFYALK